MSITHGTFTTLSNQAIIASAKEWLGLGDTTDVDIKFEKLIDEGTRRLDCLSLFGKKVRSLKVHNNMAELPRGFVKYIGLRVGTPPSCLPAIYVSMPFIQECGCSVNAAYLANSFTVFEIQNNHIVFHPNTTVDAEGNVSTDNITDCTLAYFGYNVDESGLMQIFEHYEIALRHYVCWHYSWQNFERYPRDFRKDHEAQFIAQKKYVKSVDFANNGRDNKRSVMEIVNAVLVDKYWFNC